MAKIQFLLEFMNLAVLHLEKKRARSDIYFLFTIFAD